MAGFLKVDYSNTGDFAPLPIGDYECIVASAEVTTASTGSTMIKAKLTIREDVDQQGKKRNFFDNLVIADNMMWKFAQVLKACGLSQDEANALATPEDMAAAIQYKPVVIRNKHRVYQGETQDSVGSWKPSTLEDGSVPEGDPFAGGGQIDISDDDLPF